jgi:hypothetical protein
LDAGKSEHAELSEDASPGEATRAASIGLVPLDEEVPHAITDIAINGPMCLSRPGTREEEFSYRGP